MDSSKTELSEPANRSRNGGLTVDMAEDQSTLKLSTDGQSVAHQAIDFQLTGTVGRYELLRLVGRGGYGIVYLANDTLLGRQVAIKIARPELIACPDGLARFQRESRVAATLEHPGIVPVFDCGEDAGLHYYVMPYIDCGHLGQWQAQQAAPLDERLIAQLLFDLTEAVRYGHEHGIVHRDLKPQNILIKPDASHPVGYRPLVLDFGLCGTADTSGLSTTQLAGTPRYMSPEQGMFGPRQVTERSDIYSLGVILYELITGQPPHLSSSLAEAMWMLHHTPIRSPRELRPTLSPYLELICLQCLRKDPQRRYSSAQALGDDLRSFLRGQTIAARPQSLWERIDFGIRFGDWEPRLGWGIIAVNALLFCWAFGGALVVGTRFSADPSVTKGFGEWLAFLTFFALPLHSLGAVLGWTIVKRTTRDRLLLVAAILSALWTVYLWFVFQDERPFLSIYENQGYAQVMAFMLIALGFSLQSLFLAAGAWAAYCRRIES